jgi:hypothetical protein
MQECSICLDAIVMETTGSVSMACGHTYHMSCISRWLTTTPTCPTCRHNATTTELPYTNQPRQDNTSFLFHSLNLFIDRTDLPFQTYDGPPIRAPAFPPQLDVPIPHQDIDLVVQESNVSHERALTVLKRYNGDIVNSIIYLTSTTAQESEPLTQHAE